MPNATTEKKTTTILYPGPTSLDISGPFHVRSPLQRGQLSDHPEPQSRFLETEAV
jgi:hypothetical protein